MATFLLRTGSLEVIKVSLLKKKTFTFLELLEMHNLIREPLWISDIGIAVYLTGIQSAVHHFLLLLELFERHESYEGESQTVSLFTDRVFFYDF